MLVSVFLAEGGGITLQWREDERRRARAGVEEEEWI